MYLRELSIYLLYYLALKYSAASLSVVFYPPCSLSAQRVSDRAIAQSARRQRRLVLATDRQYSNAYFGFESLSIRQELGAIVVMKLNRTAKLKAWLIKSDLNNCRFVAILRPPLQPAQNQQRNGNYFKSLFNAG